jgi:ecotin
MLGSRPADFEKADAFKFFAPPALDGTPSRTRKEELMKKLFSITALGLVSAALTIHAGDAMKAFPPPGKGMVRYVLQLPKQDDESAFKVQPVVGKTVLLDEHNRYFFSGKIQQETIKGWGFLRYNVSQLGPMAGTQMAVDPNAPRLARFVTLGCEPYLIRYNSRLPVVVYAPEGVEVRYRIWTAEPEMKGIDKG